MTHGLRPPETARVKRPRFATACRGGRGDELGATLGGGLRVGEDLDLERHQLVFSSWPPNCLRIAESSRFSKSSSPRDENRE